MRPSPRLQRADQGAAMPHACTDPHHHVHSADAFVRAVERACTERGLRLTPIRANVLRLIADAGRPMKAYDLLERVRETKGAGADAPPTVYRALDFLMANGFRSEEHTSELQSREK